MCEKHESPALMSSPALPSALRWRILSRSRRVSPRQQTGTSLGRDQQAAPTNSMAARLILPPPFFYVAQREINHCIVTAQGCANTRASTISSPLSHTYAVWEGHTRGTIFIVIIAVSQEILGPKEQWIHSLHIDFLLQGCRVICALRRRRAHIFIAWPHGFFYLLFGCRLFAQCRPNAQPTSNFSFASGTPVKRGISGVAYHPSRFDGSAGTGGAITEQTVDNRARHFWSTNYSNSIPISISVSNFPGQHNANCGLRFYHFDASYRDWQQQGIGDGADSPSPSTTDPSVDSFEFDAIPNSNSISIFLGQHNANCELRFYHFDASYRDWQQQGICDGTDSLPPCTTDPSVDFFEFDASLPYHISIYSGLRKFRTFAGVCYIGVFPRCASTRGSITHV